MTGTQFLVQNLAQFMPQPQAAALGEVAAQIDAGLAKDKRIAELEAKVAELEAASEVKKK